MSPFRSARQAGLAIFVLAVLVRLVVAWATGAYHLPTLAETVCVARSIDTTGNFADAFCGSTVPTAHLAPVYPYFVAFILRVFPGDVQFTAAIISLGILSSALLWSLLPMVAEQLELGIAGVIGGFLGAATPLLHYIEFAAQWEAVASAFALIFLCIFTLRTKLTGSVGPALLWGCAWGAAMLLLPSFLPVYFILSIFLAGTGRCSLRNAVASLVCLVAVISPWIVRDYRELGGFALIRDNLGLELSISNNSEAQPATRENFDNNAASTHPSLNKAERDNVRRLGELEYNRRRLHTAVSWIQSNRAAFAHLTALRVYHFWVTTRAKKPLTWLEFGESALAWIGLWRIVREREKPWFFFLVCFAVYPLIYYLIQSEERYRYPIEWIRVLCAAYALADLLRFVGVPLPAKSKSLSASAPAGTQRTPVPAYPRVAPIE